jgi:hypothetical protein
MALGWTTGCAGRAPRDFDPRAEKALHDMSKAIGGAKSFTFCADSTMDELIAPGQLAQFSRENRIVLRRPDRIRAEGHQEDDSVYLWYDGRKVTMLDKNARIYAAVDAPDRIDALLPAMAAEHGLTLPLADLLVSDPRRVLTADASTGRYLGLENIGGVECHHLLFIQGALDWQIWIAASGPPVPRKFVIDYKLAPERPQFTATFRDWNLSAPALDDEFKPVIPADARNVTIAELLAAGRGE